jgi:hypothetical protein
MGIHYFLKIHYKFLGFVAIAIDYKDNIRVKLCYEMR